MHLASLHPRGQTRSQRRSGRHLPDRRRYSEETPGQEPASFWPGGPASPGRLEFDEARSPGTSRKLGRMAGPEEAGRHRPDVGSCGIARGRPCGRGGVHPLTSRGPGDGDAQKGLCELCPGWGRAARPPEATRAPRGGAASSWLCRAPKGRSRAPAQTAGSLPEERDPGAPALPGPADWPTSPQPWPVPRCSPGSPQPAGPAPASGQTHRQTGPPPASAGLQVASGHAGGRQHRCCHQHLGPSLHIATGRPCPPPPAPGPSTGHSGNLPAIPQGRGGDSASGAGDGASTAARGPRRRLTSPTLGTTEHLPLCPRQWTAPGRATIPELGNPPGVGGGPGGSQPRGVGGAREAS